MTNLIEPIPETVPESTIRSIIGGLMMIILLAALDQTIVSVSLPQMARELGGGSLLAWVVSGYLVAATVSTPIYGKLGDLYGRRRLLYIGIAIFLFASVGCAFAQTMPMLILARIAQGIGGGSLISTSQAIIGEVVPLRERGKYQGYISVVFAVASVGGPVLGGYLTHYLSWRWIFWINLPLGAAAFWASYRALKILPVPGIRRPIDYFGAALLTTGLSALLVAITRIGQGIGLLAPDNLWLLAAAMLALGIFIWHEHRTAEPILPPSLFRSRAVPIGCAITFLTFFQVVSLSVLVPLGMQTLDRIAADVAALRLIAFSLAVPFGAFLGGRMMAHSGRYRPPQLIGSAVVTLAVFMLAWIGPHTNFLTGATLATAGVALGMAMPTSLVAVQNAVSHKDIGVATAITALFRTMGGAVGVAVLSSILFALLRGSSAMPGSLGLEGAPALSEHAASALQHGNAADASEADFAFKATFLVSALAALAMHGLAWIIPENILRGANEAEAEAREESEA